MQLPQPTVLGLRKSFGLATGWPPRGHVAAVRNTGFVPIFAQQSVREMERTKRTPEQVLGAAQNALAKLGWTQPWGADADHHKTAEDVRRSAAAGFTFFTIDPSALVNNAADRMSLPQLEAAIKTLETEGILPDAEWRQFYLGGRFEVSERLALRFTPETLCARRSSMAARSPIPRRSRSISPRRVSAGRSRSKFPWMKPTQ
jgi:hypothetical protein